MIHLQIYPYALRSEFLGQWHVPDSADAKLHKVTVAEVIGGGGVRVKSSFLKRGPKKKNSATTPKLLYGSRCNLERKSNTSALV